MKEASYARQRRRGIKRKLKLVELKGGCCEICGYDKNLAVLTFHHTDLKTKKFNVELRNIANYNWKKVLEESSKCQLLCQNCHQELHHPDFSLKKLLTNLERLSILEEYKFLIVYTNTIGYVNNLVENFGYKKNPYKTTELIKII